MAELQISSQYATPVARTPIWPLLVAPLVAAAYYLALKQAFILCLKSVVADASDVASHGSDGPEWGSHWIYRAFAELISVPFGTFVAAGIDQTRAKLAGLIGGLAISAVYLLKNLALLIALYRWPGYYELIEPWSQHVMEGLIVIGAPYAGFFLGEAASEMISRKPEGFVGINRVHFLWLWIPAMAYASGVISPLLNAWVGSIMSIGQGDIVRTIVFGVPVVVFSIPGLWGLLVLAHENRWSHTTNNIAGPFILIVGWFLATGFVYVWSSLVTRLLTAVFS